MAIAMPQRVPLPDLGSINNNRNEHHDDFVNKASFDDILLSRNDSAVTPETPTSSENDTERLDLIALLARPMEGYHRPRHHLFTDRLIGRFFEDCSLNAETRKKSKSLAGHLGTAESGSQGRPMTTASASKTLPHLRSSHSSRSRCGKRVHVSSSAHSLGDARQTMRVRISARRGQVEKEIKEHKALIEKLEGQMASLLFRGGRATRSQKIDARAAQESQAIYGSDGNEVDIQRSFGEIGKRKRFLSLCSAREEFESHLQAMVCQTEALAREIQIWPATGAMIASVDGVSAAVEVVLEASREADFSNKPPLDILRTLFSGMGRVSETLVLLGAAVRDDGQRDHTRQTFEAIELSFSAAKATLEAIREALGADAEVEEPKLPIASSTKDRHPLPAGSGRAAALATASTRGGLLVSPEASNHQEVSKDELDSNINGNGNHGAQQDERQQTRNVKLSTLGVEGIATLLHANGFGEYTPRFVSEAVDGVMLSDPHLCEADFLELGVGNCSPEGDCRTRIVAFFQRCQREGVALSGTSQPVFEKVTKFQPESSKQGKRGNRSGGEGLTSATSNAEKIERGKNLVSAAKAESVRRNYSEAANPMKHDVIFEIPTDSNGGGTIPAVSRDTKRMSVKLNHGVIVTVDGVEVNVVQTVDGWSDDGRNNEQGDKGEGVVPPAARYAPPAIQRSRRTSLGIPAVSLESEIVCPNNRESCTIVDQQLPPGIAVKTSDTTLNVFP